MVEALAALGLTWLTHFLFIFKTSGSHETQSNQDPHELATPTLDKTRIRSFSNDVKARDGYKCILSGYGDLSRPSPDENIPGVYLKACHILRRAIGQLKKDHESDSFMSATTTFDILANYARLPIEMVEDLQNNLDDPSNGMTLDPNAHDAFDMFDWCLKATGVSSMALDRLDTADGASRSKMCTQSRFSIEEQLYYTGVRKALSLSESKVMTRPSGSSRKRNRGIPLPNPRYLAIHAAIAEILHMSAAGKFFDELLNKYKDNKGKFPPVRSWLELERLMDEGVLRDSIQSLQLVGVH